MENNEPVNCSECGRVLFKVSGDSISEDTDVVIRCACGELQRVTAYTVLKIKVEAA